MSAAADRRDTEPRLRRVARLLAALCAGPATWAVQLVAGYAVASYACFPHDVAGRQAPPPGWTAEPAILLAVNVACLALDVAGVAYCVARLRGRPRNGREAADVRLGRTRFLAVCGVMAGLIFAGATLFNTANIVMVPTCWSIPR